MSYREFVCWSGMVSFELFAREASFAEAERELVRVHHIEWARLLRDASRLRCAELAYGAARSRRALSRWRTACRDALDLTRRDGRAGPRLLQHCLARPLARWPRPIALARAAQAFDCCDAGRVQLARAEVAQGAHHGAIERLEALLAREPRSEPRSEFWAEALHVLALARIGAGEARRALADLELAASSARCALEPLVTLLALALREADAERVAFARERLARIDCSVPGMQRRLRGATRRLRARLAREERALARSAATCRLAREVAAGGPAAAAEIARCLF